MPKTAESTPAKTGNKAKNNFSWTDEESALLLQIIIDYKSNKTALGLDWETIKSKYEDICERMISIISSTIILLQTKRFQNKEIPYH